MLPYCMAVHPQSKKTITKVDRLACTDTSSRAYEMGTRVALQTVLYIEEQLNVVLLLSADRVTLGRHRPIVFITTRVALPL